MDAMLSTVELPQDKMYLYLSFYENEKDNYLHYQKILFKQTDILYIINFMNIKFMRQCLDSVCVQQFVFNR